MKAKRAAKSRKSRKSPKAQKAESYTAEQNAEADRILGIWKTASGGALGSKQFDAIVFTKYEPKLRAKVLSRLKSGDLFDAAAEAATKTVATDLGTVCAMLTKGQTVSKDTFQTVFQLMKDHPACPQRKSGAGTWCDIPL